jgi:hypothetical protein
MYEMTEREKLYRDVIEATEIDLEMNGDGAPQSKEGYKARAILDKLVQEIIDNKLLYDFLYWKAYTSNGKF